jgi:hypothetical protein
MGQAQANKLKARMVLFPLRLSFSLSPPNFIFAPQIKTPEYISECFLPLKNNI